MAGETWQYYVRGPTGKRRSWAVVRRRRGADGKTSESETVESSALDAINREFQAGRMLIDEAREAVRREVVRLREVEGGGKRTTLRPSNLRTLKRYWAAVFETRQHEDRDAAWNRLRRGVEALGDTPLTADRDTLQKTINTACAGKPVRQREAVSVVNGILKWMGRGADRLAKTKKPRRRVRFLTLGELDAVLPHVSNETDRGVFRRAVYTGTRIGEQFGLRLDNLRPDGRTIFVEGQMKRDGREAETKNRRTRDVPILPEGVDAVRGWLDVGWEDRLEIRNRQYAKILRAACRKAFPGRPEKHLTLHNLRDSYAIHLLQRGVPIELVAQALGDTIAVVQEAYVGFVLTPTGVEQIHARLSGR